MIIPSNNATDPTSHELKAHPPTQTEHEIQPLSGEVAPPPSYYPSDEHVTASTSSSNTAAQPTFKSKPTNHLYLFNDNSSVKGEYVIDPCMNIPASLLPPLPQQSETDRKNLCIHSKNGAVNADIWLLGAQSAQLSDSKVLKRTILDLGSENGSVTARIQTTRGTAPFLLTISTMNGAVYVTLPRSFNGLLLLTTKHGSISLADALSENCTYLSQVDTTRRYFVGDLSMVDDTDWTGDEVRVEARHGKIKVKYIDENTCVDNTKGGLLNRLFGW